MTGSWRATPTARVKERSKGRVIGRGTLINCFLCYTINYADLLSYMDTGPVPFPSSSLISSSSSDGDNG